MYENVQTSVHRRSPKQIFLKFCNIHRKKLVVKPLFNKVSGLKACIFIWIETATQVLFSEYCEQLFYRRPVHYTFPKFLFDWYFRVMFYYCKIRPRNRKNFAIDRSKFVFRYLIISLLQRFVCSSNCKEKLVALNWIILLSILASTFSPEAVTRRCSVEKVFIKDSKNS